MKIQKGTVGGCMRMKILSLALVISSLILGGCNVGGEAGGAGGGSGISALSSTAAVDNSFHTYTFEVTGNGIRMSTVLDGYDDFNYQGVHSTAINDANRLYGAATVTFTIVAKSINGSFTYNAGPGLINIITKKDGDTIRNDNLIIGGAQAIILIAN